MKLFESMKNKEQKSQTPAVKTGTFKRGGLSILLCVVLAAVLVVINLLVGALPTTFTKPDISSQQLYSISPQTEEMAAALTQDVNIYLLAQQENQDDTITELLGRYESASKHIHVEVVDPVTNPGFAATYTEASLNENSVIVASGDRSKVINYTDIYVTDYSSYYTTGSVSTSFDGEGQLTSAIQFVTSDDLAKMYVLTGHGEAPLPESFSSSLSKENVACEELNLMTVDAIPADASCLLLAGPSDDLTADEQTKIAAYLQNGGSLLVYTNFSNQARPNLEAIMANYGLEKVQGIVIEGDPSRSMSGYQHYLVPVYGSHQITQPLSEAGSYVLAPITHGILENGQAKATTTITPILSSTDKSYCKMAGQELTTLEKEEGDMPGPFYVAAIAEDVYGTTVSRVAWFSTAGLLDESIDSAVSGGNMDLFLNTTAWATGQEQNVTIHAKVMGNSMLTLNNAEKNLWTYTFIIIIPLLTLVIGFVIWIQRRRGGKQAQQ